MSQSRNSPCWCGSGKKYKKCHIGRETQIADNPWDKAKELKRIFGKKVCMHPKAGPQSCSGPIVNAHTVRRQADLVPMARDGHVYSTKVDFGTLCSTGGKPGVGLLGINKASVFCGFCQYHDTKTFASLEQEEFIPTSEQIFLLLYRAWSRELYLKQQQLESTALIRQADKGRPPPSQLAIQGFAADLERGQQAALRELRAEKARLDAMLLAKDYTAVHGVVVYFDVPPVVLCSGGFFPERDFQGRQLQDLADLHTLLDGVTFSLLTAADGNCIAILAWHSHVDITASRMLQSFEEVPRSEQPDALLWLAFSMIENVFMEPEWWEELPQPQRTVVLSLIGDGIFGDGTPNAASTRHDGTRLWPARVLRMEKHGFT